MTFDFIDILNEAKELHKKKSHDYASNENPFGNYNFAGEFAKKFKDNTDAGLMGRFAEKLYRLINLEDKDPLNESVEDTELDLVVILTLFAANRRERRRKLKESSLPL